MLRRVTQVCFVSDVDGVFDRPPTSSADGSAHTTPARLLRRVCLPTMPTSTEDTSPPHSSIVGATYEYEASSSVAADTLAADGVPVTVTAAHDVTGGISAKLTAAMDCVMDRRHSSSESTLAVSIVGYSEGILASVLGASDTPQLLGVRGTHIV